MTVDRGSEDRWLALHGEIRRELVARGLPHLTALGGEYVQCLRTAEELRRVAEADPFSELASGRRLLHPAFEGADREIRRAVALAKMLGLNGRSAGAEEGLFAELDAAEPVRIEERRRRRARDAG